MISGLSVEELFMKTVFMFPGQGSQSVGMMAGLLEAVSYTHLTLPTKA